MVDLQTISIVIASMSVVIGMIIGVEQIRDFKKTRKSEIAVQFYQSLAQKEFTKQITDVLYTYNFSTHDEWIEKYGPRVNSEAYATTMSIIFIFSSIGMFLREKLVDPNSLFQIWHPLVIMLVWRQIEPIVKHWREHYEYQELFEPFEYLVNVARQIAPGIRFADRS